MQKIHGRKTVVKPIDLTSAQIFLENNHRQGSSRSVFNKESIGLFYNNELVAVAQFSLPRTSLKKRQYSIELLRLCFKEKYTIQGGASKLIKYFIKEYNPLDIFTYQDTTGKNTDVYEKCGFTLAKEEKKKEYLVKNGKTIVQGLKNSASREEYYTLSQVVSRGPDALLKTDIGEQFNEDGSRKTNIELFLDLGWHIEETSGDKIYEWFNPNVSFYTYKITATDSDKYYYGVRSINKAFDQLNIEDCLEDNYFGSGGTKFSNWKKKHKENIVKSIIDVFPYRYIAYNSEKKLIGDLWKTDPLCLNSSMGGVFYGKPIKAEKFNKSNCKIHGYVKHFGTVCCKCFALKTIQLKICEIHGSTKFKGDYCSKCVSLNSVKMRNCPVHGETKFRKNKCSRCSSVARKTKECYIHGFAKHHGDTCLKCSNNSFISIKNCEIHGDTKFRKNKCAKCLMSKSFSKKFCEIHGESVHTGDLCVSCKNNTFIKEKECEIHNSTKHIGDTCYKCSREKYITVKFCQIHGETKHQGNACAKCVNNSKISIKICTIHGSTKHFGNSCGRCSSLKMFSIGICDKHGETKFKSSKCLKCSSQTMFSEQICELHGSTKFKGKSCCKCSSERTAHARWHKTAIKENCRYCYS